ncbi:glycosyltransferase [Providencia sp. wls1914]|nr:glycosyltransferase [Providencia sp. wls1914]
MQKNNLVSVIIPTYGRAKYLSNAINSVLKQTYKNIEIIVIDDNTESNHHFETLSLIESYNDNRIKYIFENQNQGGALARNKGIKIASGNYITFLDDDDLYLENKIEEQLNHILKFDLDVSVCDMYFSENGKLVDKKNCYANVNSITDFLLDGNSYTPMIMCTKKIIEQVNYFTDSPRYQDHILTLKFLKITSKIKRLPKKLFIHNNHDGQRITLSEKSEQGYFIRKNQELELLNKLSEQDKKKYFFKTELIEIKIERKNGLMKSLYRLLKLSLKTRNLKNIKLVIKTLFIIIFLPKRNI